MLIGYDKDGEIKFYFTDEDYLKKQFPNNTAKVSNFWKTKDHGLKEMFIDNKEFKDALKSYKIVSNKLIKKELKEKRAIKEIIDISNNTTFTNIERPKGSLMANMNMPESREAYEKELREHKNKEAV